ncbi:MAG TPA: AMP-binding protein [Acidimicrobiia bacterium]
MTSAQHTAELLRLAAAEHPDREAYVHGNKRVTYAWLDRAADGFAAHLLALGATPGDVVCLMLPSSIELAAAYLGSLRAGTITSAINTRLGPVEQRSILDRTRPIAILLGTGITIPEGADPGTVIRVPELDEIFETPPPAELPDLGPSDIACVVWTSGTTGAPKGAVYDHAACEAISRNMGQLTEPGDRRLVVLPFAHIGYMTRMWDELANGTTVVIAGEPWSAAETLRLIREEWITMGTGVPTQWELVLAHPDLARTDFTQLRVCGIGGASISPDLVRRMRETLGCPVITRYTSTEAGVATSTVVGDPDDVVAGTVGRAAPEVELRIASPVDGTPLPVGEVGEIVVRSPAMMRGYWHDEALTTTAIDSEGFLHTGDLGTLDEVGNVRIVGRLKEMYIRGGYNVYPAEVEAALSEHPGIVQAAVVGAPDDVLGQIGVAFVVPAGGAAQPTLDEVREWCRARIADYKAPDRLVVLDELPLNATHKVDKQALLELEDA